MDWKALLASWMAEAPVMAGSFAVVALMVGVAYAIGFRASRTLSEADLARFAAAEGAALEQSVFAANGRAAFARLSGAKVLVARVMGADISARVTPINGVRVRVTPGRLVAQFADIGFPPLDMKLKDSPAWLSELAGAGNA